jgi:L-fuconolactonase
VSNSDVFFDTHAHIIAGDNPTYPPAPISGRLRPGVFDNPMTGERLIDEMDAKGVKRAALVQRAHVYGYDNSYVIDVSARHPDRFGAICVIDSVALGAGARAAEWMDKGAIGIRLTEPERGADGAWLNGTQARKVWEVVAKRNGTISIQIYMWNRANRMPEILTLASEFANVPVLVEHLSNITENAKGPNYGVDLDLDVLADLRNVYLKLTTINLARCKAGQIDAKALIARLISKFTHERILWGSDVAQSPQSYAEMTAMARDAVSELDETQRMDVLFKTADRLFAR